MTEPVGNLGWWAISGSELLAALRRVSQGEDPDMAYAELYANTSTEEVDADE